MAEIRRRQKPVQRPGSQTTAAENLQTDGSYCCNLCCKVLLGVAVVLLIVVGIVFLPSSIDPVPVKLPSLDEFKEKHGSNDELTKVKHLFNYDIATPRAMVVDAEGNSYAGLSNGQIIAFDNEKFKRVARFGKPPYHFCDQLTNSLHCGCITGMSTAPNDSSVLYMSDCNRGIFRLDLQDGQEAVSVVDTSLPIADVPPMKMITDLAVLSNGSIFFTDGSSKFVMNESLNELFEARDNGKLLHYNPVDKSVQMVASGLHFPNGLCASDDESFLLVSDATRFRILKYHLKGPKAGQMSTFADKLPGMPSKISLSSKNGFWVGFSLSRLKGRLDRFFAGTVTRRLVFNLNLITYFLSSREHDGMVMELDKEGDVARFLYDEKGEGIATVFGAWQVGNSLYLASRMSPFIGFLEIDP